MRVLCDLLLDYFAFKSDKLLRNPQTLIQEFKTSASQFNLEEFKKRIQSPSYVKAFEDLMSLINEARDCGLSTNIMRIS
jgi:hypothetical protein